MNLNALVKMSHKYGADEEYVLAGGGNTSYKEGGVLYVKASGAQLSDIKPEQFVAMDIKRLREMVERVYPADKTDDQREAQALADMMEARLPEETAKRPSVESILHALFLYKLVLHVHPPLINGLTCGVKGESVCKRMFGEEAIWIGLTKPGLVLAQVCKKAFEEYTARTERFPQIVLLENHGIFISADTPGEIDSLMEHVVGKLKGSVTGKPDFGSVEYDKKLACSIAPALRMLYAPDGKASLAFCVNRQVLGFLSDYDSFKPLMKPFLPDHIVYYKDEPLYVDAESHIGAEFSSYLVRKGYKPKIVAVRGLGFFAIGATRGEAEQSRQLFLDAVKIAVYARSFGGERALPDEFTSFIVNWEVEQYRAKASTNITGGRLEGRIALITGGAQGFGKGIAESLAAEGAYVAVADINSDGAAHCAGQINSKYGQLRAVAVSADVTNEESAERMVQETVLAFGGLDVLISNAGVLVAGGLADITKKNFDFVTSVNYTGYFLCAKYASEPMKIQHKYAPGYLTDIIEINSKSGLEGSNRNFAYAGSKFGGIGLTQSFALELVDYGIKVNAICPGNLLDGPLWSDPEKGLFKQYLDSGKVPGAKTIEDVRRHYEAKVPMKRGCTIPDVARAILYVIEQKYETGQAVPVTGGQIMLN